MITKNDILATVVLYGSALDKCNTFTTLLKKEFDLSVFIYDNSQNSQHSQAQFPPHYHYVSDPSNPGLSTAYNKAAQYALQNGFNWLMLLDQDTIFTEGVMDQYIEAINNNTDCNLFVAPMQEATHRYMSPVKKRFLGSKLECTVPYGKTDLKKYCAINSGMIINVEAFKMAGGYNEKVFLDFSDYEFLERYGCHHKFFFTIATVCQQEFSNQTQTKQEKLNRFILFCRSFKNCRGANLTKKISYLCIVLKRMISLSLSAKSITPLLIFIRHYL